MAYTFTDHYRAVRWILRIDAVVVGLGVGALLLVYPEPLLNSVGFIASGSSWPARIGGSGLLGQGLGLLFAASEPELRVASLLSAIVSNGLIAMTLLFAYMQNELNNLTFVGSLALIAIFIICLLATVMPIPYLRGVERYR